MDHQSERTTFVVDKHITSRAEAARVCDAVLDLLRPHLRSVTIDAYSDYHDQLPEDVVTAEARLKDLGGQRGGSDRGMGIDLDPSREDHWRILRTYAAWSINVDLFGEHGRELGCLHDCGYSVVAELTSAEAGTLSDQLSGVAPLLPLTAVGVRRRAERDDARAAGRDRRRARINRLFRRS